VLNDLVVSTRPFEQTIKILSKNAQLGGLDISHVFSKAVVFLASYDSIYITCKKYFVDRSTARL
jgi:hypothetical protein